MADETTTPAGYPVDPYAGLQNIYANLGIQIDPTALGAAPQQQLSLDQLLIGSAMDVTGRYGMTGQAYRGGLPQWAQGVPQQALDSTDFDPYLGIVSQQGDERVYMGEIPASPAPGRPAGNKFSPTMDGQQPGVAPQATPASDETLTLQQASNMPYTWDEAEVADAMQKMRDAGMSVDSFDGLVEAWGSLVYRAAMTYSLSEGKRKVTPWDVLDLYKDEAQASGVLGTQTRTMVSRNVTDIDEGEAWSNLQGTLSQMLGRDPDDQELRDFTYRMNQLAARNPSVSKTITKYKNGEATSSSTHTKPGFTSADMAMEAYDSAQADPDYAEYQAASTYFNALQTALGPIGG